MKPEDFRAMLERYERGICSPEEKELVEQWYNNVPEDDADTPNDVGAGIWSAIAEKNNLKQADSPSWYLKVAAAVAMFLVIGYLLFDQPLKESQEAIAVEQVIPKVPTQAYTNAFENTSTVAQEIALEDGSTILVQPGGRISYPGSFASDSRSVSLSGEAFFTIQRDEQRPFYVFTREVVTKVLGTSFTIKAHDQEPEITVAVKTGKVRVFTKAGDDENSSTSVTLTPNQQVVYNREAVEISKKLVAKPEIILEKPTIFEMKYDGVPVTRIFKVLEENYGVDIQFDEETWDECFLTTKMSNEGLLERIEIITKAIGASYSDDDAVITINGAGCN